MNRSITSAHGRRIRGIVYFAAPVVFFAAAVGLAGTRPVERVVAEGGFVESFQNAMLLCCVSLLGYCAWQFPMHRGFLTFAAALGGLALLREMNNSEWYRIIFPFHGASTVLGMLVLSIVVFQYRHELNDQLWQAARAPSFMYLCVGGIIVVGWAQVLAQKSLFQERTSDRAAEECLEAAGYMIILGGVIERYLELRMLSRSNSDHRVVTRALGKPDAPFRPAAGTGLAAMRQADYRSAQNLRKGKESSFSTN